jgi:hypothetical protein
MKRASTEHLSSQLHKTKNKKIKNKVNIPQYSRVMVIKIPSVLSCMGGLKEIGSLAASLAKSGRWNCIVANKLLF